MHFRHAVLWRADQSIYTQRGAEAGVARFYRQGSPDPKILKGESYDTEKINEIDKLIYHIYDLTYDEVLIIDPETPISREEYENLKIEES